jgi:hypothetical protein
MYESHKNTELKKKMPPSIPSPLKGGDFENIIF